MSGPKRENSEKQRPGLDWSGYRQGEDPAVDRELSSPDTSRLDYRLGEPSFEPVGLD